MNIYSINKKLGIGTHINNLQDAQEFFHECNWIIKNTLSELPVDSHFSEWSQGVRLANCNMVYGEHVVYELTKQVWCAYKSNEIDVIPTDKLIIDHIHNDLIRQIRRQQQIDVAHQALQPISATHKFGMQSLLNGR